MIDKVSICITIELHERRRENWQRRKDAVRSSPERYPEGYEEYAEHDLAEYSQWHDRESREIQHNKSLLQDKEKEQEPLTNSCPVNDPHHSNKV